MGCKCEEFAAFASMERLEASGQDQQREIGAKPSSRAGRINRQAPGGTLRERVKEIAATLSCTQLVFASSCERAGDSPALWCSPMSSCTTQIQCGLGVTGRNLTLKLRARNCRASHHISSSVMLKRCAGLVGRRLIPVVEQGSSRQLSRSSVAVMAQAAKAEAVNGSLDPAVEAKVGWSQRKLAACAADAASDVIC